MVVAYGVAMLEEDDIWDRTRELVARYYPDQPEQVAPHMERIFEGQKRVLITVEPDNVITRRPN